MKKIVEKIINLIAKMFPIKKDKILFQSGRNKVDCNPYAIYKYIKENCSNDFRCVWLVEKGTDVSMLEKGDFYFYKTILGIYHQITAKYWIRSQSLGGIIKKKKNQIYIQTWHGGGAFKKSGYDCLPESKRPTEPMEHVKEWDVLIATDEENKRAMISSTNYNKKTIVMGSADTDMIANATDKDKEKILKKLNLLNNKKKIILYAPTFRDDDLNKDIKEIKLPIEQLEKLEDYVILIRLHPLMNNKISKLKLPHNFINVGNYPNIQDLFLIADILITDYSSIIFPFSLLNKSIVLYPYDIENYIKLRGGFDLDYEKLPFPICYKEDDLLITIKNIKKENSKYKKDLIAFNKKYNYLNDGHVSERFITELKKGNFDIK